MKFNTLAYNLSISVLCCIFNLNFLQAQQTDTYFLSELEFITILRKFHPIIKQADLGIEQAKSNLLASRAAFDPVFNYHLDRKTFDGRNYFTYINPELRMPTWYGIELKAGMEDNTGNNFNQEVTIGVSSYLGVKVPLARNLLFDERRAVLGQAKLFVNLSKIERDLLINDLYYNAIATYWNWVMEFNTLKVLDSVVAINEQRFRLLKLSWQQGDIPAIDTIEAQAQLQNFIIQQQDILYKFIAAGYTLSNYLWLDNSVPFEMNNQVFPSGQLNQKEATNNEIQPLVEMIAIVSSSHPKLKQFQNKLQILDIDRKLNFQSLLPKFDLKANLLNNEYFAWKGINAQLLENNYKFGVDVQIPLRFSEGRGKFRATQFKIQDTEYGQIQERLALINELKSRYQQVLILQKQITWANSNFENYSRLFKGELTRFSVGESSLFLLNMRENKMLESRIQLIEIQTRYLQSRAGLIWAAGQYK